MQEVKKERDVNLELNTNLNLLISLKNWNEVNWQDEVRKIEELNHEKVCIETSNNKLKILQDNLIKISEEITQLETDKTSKTKTFGSIEENIKNHREEITECKSASNIIQQDEMEHITLK